MLYCSSCGTEVSPDTSYCPNCGDEIDLPSETTERTTESDKSPCRKCDSQISVEADRCPECGYEPGPGILGGIIMWIAFSIGTLFAVIAVVSLIVIIDGFPIIQGLTVAGFTGFIAVVFFGIVYAGLKGMQLGPTDEPLGASSGGGGGGSESMSASWQDSAERGERWAEQINTAYYAAVRALPTWLWTVGVLLGCVLSFAIWPATAAENETAMSVSFIAGSGLLFLVILVDTLRLNHAYNDLDFRWWFWSILAFVPLIGWVFGIAWLWRRRSKVNGVTG